MQDIQISIIIQTEVQDNKLDQRLNQLEEKQNLKVEKLENQLKLQHSEIQILKTEVALLNSKILENQKGIEKNVTTIQNAFWNEYEELDSFEPKQSVLKKATSHQEEPMKLKQMKTVSIIGRNFDDSFKKKPQQKSINDLFFNDPSRKTTTSLSSNPTSDQPDLVYFYSEPLVDRIYDDKTQKHKLVSTGSDQLATDLEYRRLIEILRSTGKDFQISKQAINFESLKEMVARKPKIIHISCHGDFCDEQKEFYLQFEGIGDGVADKFYQSRLFDLLGEEKDHGIKLAFVSACHSEEIGSILLKCNIPCVISVNSNWQVADEICLIFSRHLYMQLLNGVTVNKAFQEAQRTCRASKTNCESCCCAHSHTDKCKWQKYAIKNGYDKAHELHSGKCNCKLRLNKHKTNCKIYQDFMTFLRTFKDPDEEKAPPKNIWAFDDDFDFEENLVAYDQKVEDNVLCCCKKELAHDESIKFLLKGDEQNLKTVLFKNRQRGQLVEIQDKNTHYKISNIFDQSWLIGRNLQIQQCVKMLTNVNGQRFIKIKGMSGIGRHVVAVTAIKYCSERNYFRDGAYQIQIESRQNCQGFLNQLFQSMRLNIQNKEDLIDFIKNHHIVILIHQARDLLENDKENFQNLLTYLIENTNYLKIILIVDDEQTFSVRTDGLENIIKLEPLNRLYAAKVLRSYDKNNEMFIAKDADDLKNHPIFDNQLTNQQLLDIYMLLKSEKTLDDISKIFLDQKKRKSQIMTDNVVIKERNFNVQLILFTHMSKQYPDEKNLLYFLCQAPIGLTLNDIKDYVLQQPYNFGNWEQFLNDMIYQFDQEDVREGPKAQGGSINSSQDFGDITNDSCNHGFKVIFQRQNEDIHQSVYYLKKMVREFINDHVLQKSRQQQFFRFVKYFSRLGRQYVRNLNIQQNNKDFDINLLTAQIDQGLWDKPKYNLTSHIVREDDIENLLGIDNVIGRFNINEANFMEALNYDTMTSLYPKLREIPQIVQFLDELYITFPSILIMINREKDAILALDMAEKICTHFKAEMKQTLAKVQLMQISLEIKNKRIFNIQKQLLECHNLFKQTFNKLGRGETFLLEAIWHIFEHKLQLNVEKTPDSKTLEKEDLQIGKYNSLFLRRETYKKLHSQKHISDENNEIMQFFDNKNMPKNEKESSKLQLKILNSLEQAQKIFMKLKQELSYSRVVLIKSNYLYSNIKSYMDVFNNTLDDLLYAQEMFGKNLNFQHQIECLIYVSLIYLNREDFQVAKNYIHQAIGQAKQTQDFQSVIKATQILEKIQHKIQISSNNMIIVLHSLPIVELIEQPPQIQSEICLLPQTQVVEINRNHYLNQNIMKLTTLLHLNQLQSQIFIKFEFLNRQQLDYIRDYGCRILEIHSSVYDIDNKLCIESQNGQLTKLTPKEVYDALKPREGDLNVDVVFINVQNGDQIAQVFQRLGVPQVFTYGQITQPESPIDGIYPYNYREVEHCFMKHFSSEMIIRLVNKQSFYKAFQLTKKKLSNNFKSTQIDQIKWVVGQETNYGEKLFDEDDLDERKQLQIGRIEDQSCIVGPINFECSGGPLIGRKSDLHSLLKEISNIKVKMICIMGNQGVGKTRLVKEAAHYSNMRRLITDGVYYLDFSDVSSQKGIDELFQAAGIDYLLNYNISPQNAPNLTNSKSQESQSQPSLGRRSSEVKAQLKSIMLIYDNIDRIQEDIMSFKWHIKQILKQKFQIKLILTHKRKLKILKNKQEITQINLMPLSLSNQVELVKFYSLRELSVSEFTSQEQSKASKQIQKEGKSEQELLNILISNCINLQLCQGNTQALMLLAFVLRSKKMNQVIIEQVKTKKIKRLQIIEQEELELPQRPLSFFQELGKFKEKENQQKEIKDKIGLKLKSMMSNFKKTLEDDYDEPVRTNSNQLKLSKSKSKNKSKRSSIDFDAASSSKKLKSISSKKKRSQVKSFKSNEMITQFKDIKEFSDEESKDQPSIIIEEDNYDSGYNEDHYNKKEIKIKKITNQGPELQSLPGIRRFTQFHKTNNNELEVPNLSEDPMDDSFNSFNRNRTKTVSMKVQRMISLGEQQIKANLNDSFPSNILDPLLSCNNFNENATFAQKCPIQVFGQLNNQNRLVNIMGKINNEYLKNLINLEFDKKQFEVSPEECYQIRNIIINSNLEKSLQLLKVKYLKKNKWIQMFDSFGNLIFGKENKLMRKGSLDKQSFFREDYSPMMKQHSEIDEEQIDEELMPDTIKLIVPVYRQDNKLLLKQDIEQNQTTRSNSQQLDPDDANLLKLQAELPNMLKKKSQFADKKVKFAGNEKMNEIEEEGDASDSKESSMSNKQVLKRAPTYDGSASDSDGQKNFFEDMMKAQKPQWQMKKQLSKVKEERQIDMSSSSDDNSSIEKPPPEFKKSAFTSDYKVVEQSSPELDVEDMFEKNMMLFHGNLQLKKN